MNTFRIAIGLLAAILLVEVGQAAKPEQQALIWDSDLKDYEAKPGETETRFSFTATNRSDAEIMIIDVQSSCGCTVVSLPSKPWTLAPGASGAIEAKVDFRGKHGLLIKTLTVTSSEGVQSLIFKVAINDGLAAKASPAEQAANLRRAFNQQTAGADRQAVFRNDCAACHVQPTVGKLGRELFETACGICHLAEHRASMVPELAGLPAGGNRDYWRIWISQGKEGGLMPAFSKAARGPLTDEQIASLVDYLVARESSPDKPLSAPHSPPVAPARRLPPQINSLETVTEPAPPKEVPAQPGSSPNPPDGSVKD